MLKLMLKMLKIVDYNPQPIPTGLAGILPVMLVQVVLIIYAAIDEAGVQFFFSFFVFPSQTYKTVCYKYCPSVLPTQGLQKL